MGSGLGSYRPNAAVCRSSDRTARTRPPHAGRLDLRIVGPICAFSKLGMNGRTKRWKVAGEKLCELLALREQGDPTALRKRAQAARSQLMDLLYYLPATPRSLID